MSRMTKLVGVAMAGMIAWGGFAAQAHARPGYCKAFLGTYAENNAAKEAKCGICHPGMDKKVRNNYGDVVGKLIGAKDCKDEAKVKDALKKAEGEKSAIEGKTFGELIKEGKLPGAK